MDQNPYESPREQYESPREQTGQPARGHDSGVRIVLVVLLMLFAYTVWDAVIATGLSGDGVIAAGLSLGPSGIAFLAAGLTLFIALAVSVAYPKTRPTSAAAACSSPSARSSPPPSTA